MQNYFNWDVFIAIHYRVLYVYAPFADQPKLDRTADEIPEVSKHLFVILIVHMCIYVAIMYVYVYDLQ